MSSARPGLRMLFVKRATQATTPRGKRPRRLDAGLRAGQNEQAVVAAGRSRGFQAIVVLGQAVPARRPSGGTGSRPLMCRSTGPASRQAGFDVWPRAAQASAVFKH